MYRVAKNKKRKIPRRLRDRDRLAKGRNKENERDLGEETNSLRDGKHGNFARSAKLDIGTKKDMRDMPHDRFPGHCEIMDIVVTDILLFRYVVSGIRSFDYFSGVTSR